MIKSALFPTKPDPSSSPDFFIDKQKQLRQKSCLSCFFRIKTAFSCQLRGNKSSQTKHMKSYFLFDSSYYLMQNSFFTTSGRRGAKTSLSACSQIYAKMWKALFIKFFFILKTKRLFHNLFISSIIPDPIFLSMLLQERLMVFPKLFLNHQKKQLTDPF